MGEQLARATVLITWAINADEAYRQKHGTSWIGSLWHDKAGELLAEISGASPEPSAPQGTDEAGACEHDGYARCRLCGETLRAPSPDPTSAKPSHEEVR